MRLPSAGKEREDAMAEPQRQQNREHQPELTMKYTFEPGNGDEQICNLQIQFTERGEAVGDPIEFEQLTRTQATQLRSKLDHMISTWGKPQQAERAA